MASVTTGNFNYSYTVSDNGGPPIPYNSGNRSFTRLNSVTKGGSIPHWRKVIAEGGNATTNYSGTMWTVSQVPAHLKHGYQDMRFLNFYAGAEVVLEGHLLLLGFPQDPSALPTLGLTEVSATNQALTRYYSNIASIQTKLKGMVLTGELRESLRMIRHPARALRNGISDYLSFLRRNAGRVAKRRRPSFVRETWLEYSFGWRPLINDIDGAIDAFYSSKWAHPIFEMVKGTGRQNSVSFNAPEYIDVGAFFIVDFQIRHEEEVFVKYFGIQRSSGNGVPNSHSYGFSPSEFVPTVWELIPYSFLVDYFTNVGDILSSWSYRFLSNGWTSKLVRRSYKQSVYNPTYHTLVDVPYIRTYQQGDPGQASYEGKTFARTRDAVLGIPSLELQVPGRWDQWANITALTKQLSSTRKALAR